LGTKSGKIRGVPRFPRLRLSHLRDSEKGAASAVPILLSAHKENPGADGDEDLLPGGSHDSVLGPNAAEWRPILTGTAGRD